MIFKELLKTYKKIEILCNKDNLSKADTKVISSKNRDSLPLSFTDNKNKTSISLNSTINSNPNKIAYNNKLLLIKYSLVKMVYFHRKNNLKLAIH
jgi:hypothetical protein